jgi:hypothetical protein
VIKHSIHLISSFRLFVVVASATAPATQDTLIFSHFSWKIHIRSLGNNVSITHLWVRAQNSILMTGQAIIYCTTPWIRSGNLFSVPNNPSSLSQRKQLWYYSDDLACSAYGSTRIHSCWLGIVQYPMETEGEVYRGHSNTED